VALFCFVVPLFSGGCRALRRQLAGWVAGRRHSAGQAPDWDRVAFAFQLVRDEYGESIEDGDFSRIPEMAAVLDSGRAALGRLTRETLRFDSALEEMKGRILRHEPPWVIGKMSVRLLADLEKSGRLSRRPPAVPDLRRGGALHAVACAPCHGHPHGPLPPAAAHMTPRPPDASATLRTPYELFNRITYGGAGTPMPSFADTLPESDRWDIAFYLFAAQWPPCATNALPTLSASELAYLSDYNLWQRYGWGAAACLRRNIR